MHSARPDRGPGSIRKPADKVVIHVLGVFFHVLSAGGVLEAHLDGVDQAHFLKRPIPHHEPLLDPAAVAHRRSVLHVENDRILWRAQLQRGIRFFQMPAVDEAHLGLLGGKLPKVGIAGRKIANPLVGQARLIAGVVRNQAEAEVEGPQLPFPRGALHRNFNIARKRLGALDRVNPPIQAARFPPKKFLGVLHHQFIQVNHRPALRNLRHNRNVQNHPVRKQPLDGILRGLVPRGPNLQTRRHHRQSLAVVLPVKIHLPRLQARVVVPARHRQRQIVLLPGVGRGQFCQQLLVLPPAPHVVKTLPPIRRRHHLLIPLQHVLRPRKIRLRRLPSPIRHPSRDRRRPIGRRPRWPQQGILRRGQRRRQGDHRKGKQGKSVFHGV